MSRRRATALIRMAESGISFEAHRLRRYSNLIGETEESARHDRQIDQAIIAAQEAIELLKSRYLGEDVSVETNPTLWEERGGPTENTTSEAGP